MHSKNSTLSICYLFVTTTLFVKKPINYQIIYNKDYYLNKTLKTTLKYALQTLLYFHLNL